jgi:hypothetical protein
MVGKSKKNLLILILKSIRHKSKNYLNPLRKLYLKKNKRRLIK